MSFVFAAVVRSLRRKRRRKLGALKRFRRTQRPLALPPPPPPVEPGLLICVQVAKYLDNDNVHIMRFNIPSRTLDILLDQVHSDYCQGITRYVPHSHSESDDPDRFASYLPHSVWNGPFSYSLNPFCATCAIGSEVFCLDGECCISDKDDDDDDHHHHLCHALYAADFVDSVPQWKVATKLSHHSYCPTMVPMGKQLFVFQERYNFEDDDDPVPFALVHDVHGAQPSMMLPSCTFGKSAIFDLVVAPFGDYLLVVDKILRIVYYFHIQESIWIPLNFTNLDPILNHLSIMRGKPVAVAQYKSLCWIDKYDYIGAFNWENESISVGPIIGFAHEVPPLHTSRPQRSLIHLKDELFGLIWVDSSSRLHITVLLICLEAARDVSCDSPPHLLTVSVVACFCYHLDFEGSVQAAYLLNRRDDQQAEGGVRGSQ